MSNQKIFRRVRVHSLVFSLPQNASAKLAMVADKQKANTVVRFFSSQILVEEDVHHGVMAEDRRCLKTFTSIPVQYAVS